MLAFIVLIFKIIGIVLAVLLFLIALVLLVPIRYRAEGSYYEELKGKAKVSWLLGVISFTVAYDKEVSIGLRIGGIPLGKKRGEAPGEEDLEQDPSFEQQGPSKQNASPKQEASLEQEIPLEHEAPLEQEIPLGQETPPKQKKKKKNRVTFQNICDKLKLWKDKYERLKDFIHKEENINTFRLLKKQVFTLIKHISPQKLKGRIHFGFDDPYTTGQVLTYISPFYGLYAKKLAVIPDFQEKILEGELFLKGRVQVAALLLIAIRVFMDRNFRIVLKKWRES